MYGILISQFEGVVGAGGAAYQQTVERLVCLN
jgi:hypothetical protein